MKITRSTFALTLLLTTSALANPIENQGGYESATRFYQHAALSYDEDMDQVEKAFKGCGVIPVHAETGVGLLRAQTTIGYICVDFQQALPQLTIAINGTNNIHDIGTDFNLKLVDLDPKFLNGSDTIPQPKVHMGFQEAALSALQSIEPSLLALREQVGSESYKRLGPIQVTGHSLGAAIGNFTALALAKDTVLAPSGVNLTTFASPFVGDAALSQLLSEKVSHQTHYYQKMDYVTQLRANDTFAELPGRVALPSVSPFGFFLLGACTIFFNVLSEDPTEALSGLHLIKEGVLRLHTLKGYRDALDIYFQKKTDPSDFLWKIIDQCDGFIWPMMNRVINGLTSSAHQIIDTLKNVLTFLL